MEASALENLFKRYVEGNLPEEEQQALFRLILLSENQSSLKMLVESVLSSPHPQELLSERSLQPILEAITSGQDYIRLENTAAKPLHRVHFLRKWAWAAASVLLLFATGTYLLLRQDNKTPEVAQTNVQTDVPPGKDGAILTLSDGRTVSLDSLGNGEIARQSGAKVVIQNGQLSYDPTGEKVVNTVYNTMSTPRGRQFQVILPDGSKVWLNAASSIRYPTVFTGKERKVEVNGEVYFEVARDSKRPFRVKINNEMEVQVLGTHFNINTYEDEPSIKTTLLEGSVRVESEVGSQKPDDSLQTSDLRPQTSVVLQPGQQASVVTSSGQLPATAEKIIVNTDVDLDQVMAWKNGFFSLQDATFEEVARQLERWYDIQVKYERGVPNTIFKGKMDRGVNLSDIITFLNDSSIQLQLEGKILIVK